LHGWTLFSGPTHYISLATAAFFGIGTYTVGLGSRRLPFPLLLAIAGIASGILAGLVGVATLRLSGVYFVIFTLGLAELVRQVVTWLQTNFTTAVGLYVFTDFTEIPYLLDAAGAGRAGLLDGLADQPVAARIRDAHHRQ
jgi:branched-chain amino acid transport system permease protein